MKNVLVSSIVCGAWLLGCSGGDVAEATESDAEVDGGVAPPDVPADAPPVSGGCDTTQLPSASPCVLHESLGVFVAESGADGNDGSRLRPFATLRRGLEVAKASGRRVYVCAGQYREANVQLLEGVSVIGNLTCDTREWGVGTARATISTSESPAVRAKSVRAETRIEGVEIVAPAGSAPGASSIGLLAEDAGGLHFVNARVAASAAAAGLDGAEAPQMPETPQMFNGMPSAAPVVCTEGALGTFQCPGSLRAPGGAGECAVAGVRFATNPGGGGGRSATHMYDALDGMQRVQGIILINNERPYMANENGAASTATKATNVGARAVYGNARFALEPTSYTVAQPGGEGAAGADGANGGIGTFSVNGYQPGDGSQGTDGAPGQGGGGGAGVAPLPHHAILNRFRTGYGGAGGGAGGCPGLAGGVGTGGGASVAVLSFASTIRFEATSLEAGPGGRGGRGSLGSLARAGGVGGGGYTRDLTHGAPGGAGGRAGVSGHGSSGPSFALAWTGAEPVVSADITLAVAAPTPGRSREVRGAAVIDAGLPGAAAPLHSF